MRDPSDSARDPRPRSRCSWCSPRRAPGSEPAAHPRAGVSASAEGRVDEGLEAELEEQQEGTEQRLDALEAARARPAPSA